MKVIIFKIKYIYNFLLFKNFINNYNDEYFIIKFFNNFLLKIEKLY
jgi:hypothetical protein